VQRTLGRPTWVVLLSGCLVVVSALLVGVALRMSADDPDLTYSSDLAGASRDIRVICLEQVNDGKGDLEHAPLLDAGDHFRDRFRPMQGDEILKRIEDEVRKDGGDPFAVRRAINADCSDARLARVGTAVRLLGAAVVAALAAMLVPVLTRRLDRS
jgi:hypothetical protein